MRKSQIDSILSKIQKKASAVAKVRTVLPTRVPENTLDDDDEEEYVPVGTKGLIAASQKLLAVNRGIDHTDDRDSLMFKRFMSTDKLLSEGVKLDSGRIRGAIVPLIARHKNLKAIGPFVFDNYMEKFLTGNPLSSPLEEINPLHLLEQSRRSTQMGPGGIGSDQAITTAAQAIRTDQFGFIDPLAGPECLGRFTSVFTSKGWIPIMDVFYDTLLACNIDGRLEFHKPTNIVKYHYTGDMIRGEHSNISMHVTPNHRVYYATDPQKDWSGIQVKFASDIYGERIRIPTMDDRVDVNNNIPDIIIESSHWSKEPYDDLVYCATVPGSKLFVRGSPETQGFWTGNSERIGIDVRCAWGSKIGSDGKLYQKFYDRRSGKLRWLSPEDLDGLTVKLPD